MVTIKFQAIHIIGRSATLYGIEVISTHTMRLVIGFIVAAVALISRATAQMGDALSGVALILTVGQDRVEAPIGTA